MKKFPINFLRLAITSLFLLFTGIMFSQTAPVITPSGGFKIDGILRANIAPNGTTAAGDWVPRVNGTPFTAGIDNFVLSSEGVPKDPVTTRLSRDEYNNNLDNIFTQGSKFNDAISALRWGIGGAPNKNDIHNGVFHASGDNGTPSNQWVFIGGDRLDVAGTSYIDFQFLQGTVTLNANTFTGSGVCGGRTVNDINVSMEYNNGGSAPKVVIYRWVPTNDAGTAGTWDSTGSSSITSAYAKTNLVTVDVPFGGFGAGVVTYQPFAFVEAGINVTQLVTALGGNCSGLSIKTLWITTKASSSSTAALKDFMTPISLDLNFGGVNVSPEGPFCALAPNITLTGAPSGGTFTGPGVSGVTFSPTDAGIGTHTIVYTASAGVNCIKSASIQIVVSPNPTVSVNSPTKCANAPNVTVTATPGSGSASDYTYAWSVPGGFANPGSVSSFATGIAGNYSVVITNTATGCVSPSAFGTVTVNPNPAVAVNTTAVCASNVSATMSATPSGGTGPYTYVWSVPGGANPGNVASFSAAVAGNYSVVATDSKNCPSQSGNGTLTINPNPTVAVNTTAVCASNGTATMTATPSGGTAPYSYVWSVPGGDNPGNVASFIAAVAGNYSVVVTDNKSCSSTSGFGSLTINPNPGMPAVTYNPPACDQNTFSITITNVVSGTTYIVKNKNGGTIAGLSPASGYVAPDATNIVFSNIPAGDGYQVTAQVGTCVSSSNNCVAGPPVSNFTNTNTETVARVLGSATLESSITVKAMPNPFSSQVRFVINSTEQGNGTLDIYNMLGQKIKTLYQGAIPEGVSYFDLKLPAQSRNLVYVLKIGDQKITGKIVQVNN